MFLSQILNLLFSNKFYLRALAVALEPALSDLSSQKEQSFNKPYCRYFFRVTS